MADRQLASLIKEVRACRLCEGELPLGPRPVFRVSPTARVLIAGQAPSTRVHETGVPWNDASGRRLRAWLDLSEEVFYDQSRVAIVPQAFCYPGKGANGDLPPPKVCQDTWHGRLIHRMPNIATFVVAGQYAHRYHLGNRRKANLTKTVAAWREYAPTHFPVPHPSWHNNHWLRVNTWFESELVPSLREAVHRALAQSP